MTMMKSLRSGVAAALVLAMPLQALGAAVRPSAAVPTAAASVAAQDDGYRGGGIAWPAIGVIIAALVLAIIIERHNKNGRGPGFSR